MDLLELKDVCDAVGVELTVLSAGSRPRWMGPRRPNAIAAEGLVVARALIGRGLSEPQRSVVGSFRFPQA